MIFGINTTSDISKLSYEPLGEWNLRQFWHITSGIYAKYHIHVQIMLLFAYTTTHKRFVIFTCRYFKLSWNTTALSQSNCSNFSCSSIKKEIPRWGNIIAGKSCFVVYWGVKVLRILSQLHFFFFYCRRTTSMPCFFKFTIQVMLSIAVDTLLTVLRLFGMRFLLPELWQSRLNLLEGQRCWDVSYQYLNIYTRTSQSCLKWQSSK